MPLPKMQLQGYPLCFFTTTLLVSLTSQSIFAFSLTYSNPDTAAYNNNASSRFAEAIFGEQGATKTKPLAEILVPKENNVKTPFQKKLEEKFGGWDFSFAQTDLTGTFYIEYYAVLTAVKY